MNLKEPDRYYMLEYPMRVEHWVDQEGHDRFDLIPFLFSSEDIHVQLTTKAVATMASPNRIMRKRYKDIVEQVSSRAEAAELMHRKRGSSSK
jgi:hypothetical protein